MAIFYLDTSAILKRYRTENGTDVVSELYEQLASRDLLLTSHFACLEFECVAARALKAKLLTPAAHNMLLGGLARDIGEYPAPDASRERAREQRDRGHPPL